MAPQPECRCPMLNAHRGQVLYGFPHHDRDPHEAVKTWRAVPHLQLPPAETRSFAEKSLAKALCRSWLTVDRDKATCRPIEVLRM